MTYISKPDHQHEHWLFPYIIGIVNGCHQVRHTVVFCSSVLLL